MWYDLPATEVTPELRADLKVIQNRNYLDPKRFYKGADKRLPKYFQVGTVVAGATDFYSARLTKKERSKSLFDSVVNDSDTRKYLKRTFNSIQDAHRPSNRKGAKKRKNR